MWRTECCIRFFVCSSDKRLSFIIHIWALLCIISNYPYLQHTLLFWSWFFYKILLMPPYLDLLYLLPDKASSWAPHRVLPDTFVMACCAICHVNPQFTPCLMPDLQSPHHKHPTQYTSSWPAACSTYAMPGLPKAEGTKAAKYWLPKTFSSAFEGHNKKCQDEKMLLACRENMGCICSPFVISFTGGSSFFECSILVQ